MTYIIKNDNAQKLLPKLVAMSPYKVYLSQIQGVIEPIRQSRLGLSYIPPQMGGISGQRKVIDQNLVLQTIEFEIK
jgi:hypothetical protein